MHRELVLAALSRVTEAGEVLEFKPKSGGGDKKPHHGLDEKEKIRDEMSKILDKFDPEEHAKPIEEYNKILEEYESPFVVDQNSQGHFKVELKDGGSFNDGMKRRRFKDFQAAKDYIELGLADEDL